MNNLARLPCGCFVRRRDTLELSDMRLNVCRNQFFIAMLGSSAAGRLWIVDIERRY
jgi:hypothetical protein